MRKIAKTEQGVFIAESEYLRAQPGYKGVWTSERWDWDNWEQVRDQYIGKRTWMPPYSLFDSTCLLVEGRRFFIIQDRDFDRRFPVTFELRSDAGTIGRYKTEQEANFALWAYDDGTNKGLQVVKVR